MKVPNYDSECLPNFPPCDDNIVLATAALIYQGFPVSERANYQPSGLQLRTASTHGIANSVPVMQLRTVQTVRAQCNQWCQHHIWQQTQSQIEDNQPADCGLDHMDTANTC